MALLPNVSNPYAATAEIRFILTEQADVLLDLAVRGGGAMLKNRTIALALVFFAAIAPASRADSIHYTILGPIGLVYDCSFDSFGNHTVWANIDLSAPAQRLELSLPAWCGTPSVAWAYPVSGDPSTMLTVDFGECLSGSILLFTATFNIVDLNCCPALIKGPYTPGPCEGSPPVVIGCDNVPRHATSECSAASPLPQTPPDGATDVSITPLLSWTWVPGEYCVEGIGLPVFTIFYGTEPNNLDQSLVTLETDQRTLPALLPNTVYFWRVRLVDDYWQYSGTQVNFSVIRSFSTGTLVLAKPKTWGGVKSSYRD